MRKALIIVFSFFISINSFGQYQSDDAKLNILYSKLENVKFADLNISKVGVDVLVSNGSREVQDVIAIRDFALEMLGLKAVIITEEQRQQAYSTSNSICEIVNISWNIGSFTSELGAVGYYPFEIGFYFCDSTSLKFNFNLNVTGLTTTIAKPMKRAFLNNLSKPYENISTSYIDSNKHNSLKLKAVSKVYPLDKLNSFINQSARADVIEGVYELYSSTLPTSIKKIALLKENEKYLIIVLENNYFKDDWKYGEIRGELIPTSSNKLMIGKYLNLSKMGKMNISFNMLNDNLFEILLDSDKQKLTFVKL